MYDDIDFDTNPITEEEVISILGSDYRVQGDELVWRCPACPNGDTSGDNLKFNRSKGIVKCFACDYGNEIMGIIARRRYRNSRGEDYVAPAPKPRYTMPYAPEPREPKEKEIPQEKLSSYYYNCHVKLMRNKDVLRKMFQKHTIMPKTAVECLIGYDDKKDKLVFPSRAIGEDPTQGFLENTPNGAEYREYEGIKTVRRISGYEPKICLIYATNFTMEAIICEGYKDAYNLYQIMKITQPEILNYTAIFTVQNGTNSINADNCLQTSNWHRFDKVGLLMDNDEAGDKAINVARELFPQMQDIRSQYIDGYDDIQERFAKEFAPQVDIERALNADWLKEYESENLIKC